VRKDDQNESQLGEYEEELRKILNKYEKKRVQKLLHPISENIIKEIIKLKISSTFIYDFPHWGFFITYEGLKS